MSLIDWVFKRTAAPAVEERELGSHRQKTVFGPSGSSNDTGVSVTPESALAVATANACVRVIAEDLAGLPMRVHKKTSTGREEASDHEVYRLLHDPNDLMTSFSFWQAVLFGMATRGNAFVRIGKRKGNRRELLIIPSSAVKVVLDKGNLTYEVTLKGQPKVTLQPYDVLHFVGLSCDGIKGLSPIEQAANVFGITLAADKHAAKFYANGTVLSGYFKTPGKLSDGAAKRVSESWKAKYAGVDNAHHTPVLEEGLDYVSQGVPMEHCQFLQTRQFQAVEVCKMFRMMPTKVGILDKSSYSTLEQTAIEHVRSTLAPWARRIEQEINRKLFLEVEKGTYYVEIDLDGLMRGDRASQDNSFAKGIQMGWYCVNDVRKYLNLPAIEGGDTYLQPLNMQPAAPVEAEPEAEIETETDQPAVPQEEVSDEQDAKRLRPLLLDAATRLITKESKAISRAAASTKGAELRAKGEAFYETFERSLRQTLAPLVQVTHKERADETLNKIVAERLDEARRDFDDAVTFDAIGDLVERLQQWPSEFVERYLRGQFDQ